MKNKDTHKSNKVIFYIFFYLFLYAFNKKTETGFNPGLRYPEKFHLY